MVAPELQLYVHILANTQKNNAIFTLHMRRPPTGFTLIELLVVVSLIGLLASIVLVSLSSARLKAKDAAIKEGLVQMRNLMEMNANDTGSYALLQPQQWVPFTGVTCATWGVSGTYAAQAQQVCTSIVNQETGSTPGAGYWFYSGNSVNIIQKYSLLAWLPGQQIYLCVGSSGVSTDTGSSWANPGCFNNP